MAEQKPLVILKVGPLRLFGDQVKTSVEAKEAIYKKVSKRIKNNDPDKIKEWIVRNIGLYLLNQLERFVKLKGNRFDKCGRFMIPKLLVKCIRIDNIVGLKSIRLDEPCISKYTKIAEKDNSITNICINFDESKYDIKNVNGGILEGFWNFRMYPFYEFIIEIEAESFDDPVAEIDNWMEAPERSNLNEYISLKMEVIITRN